MKDFILKYSYYLAIVFPLVTAGCVYFIYRNSFNEKAIFSEELSITGTYYILLAGGIMGVFSAILGMYHTIRSKRFWVVVLRIIILFPFLFMTCIILYGFLVLKNML